MGLRVLIITDGPTALMQAALGLSHCGHNVLLCTSWEGARNLPEARCGSLKILAWPFSLSGLLGARLAWCCLYLLTRGRFDAVLHDRVSLALPLLLLLAPRPLLYSRLDDWMFPGALAALSCSLLLHSEFAATALKRGELGPFRTSSQVLRPPVDASPPLLRGGLTDRTEWHRAFEEYTAQVAFRALVDDSAPYLLLLGRYEPTQRLEMALDAFATLEHGPVLVIAGDYDGSSLHRHCHEELRLRAEMAGLERRVVFLRSVSAPLKSRLLNATVAVLYTAQRELAGTAPCEAMASAVPVIASAQGGPQETLVHGVTGFLCSSEPEFASAMQTLLLWHRSSRDRWLQMGQAARETAERLMSPHIFAQQLDCILKA